MDLSVLSALARRTMDEHGLWDWKFSFDNRLSGFGRTNFTRKLITVSRLLAAVNDESECVDTLLHEIAHALVGYSHKHGPVWREKARELGCRPEARFDPRSISDVEKKWLAQCSACKMVLTKKYQRRDFRLCCMRCVRQNNGYNKLVYFPNPRAGQVILAA